MGQFKRGIVENQNIGGDIEELTGFGRQNKRFRGRTQRILGIALVIHQYPKIDIGIVPGVTMGMRPEQIDDMNSLGFGAMVRNKSGYHLQINHGILPVPVTFADAAPSIGNISNMQQTLSLCLSSMAHRLWPVWR